MLDYSLDHFMTHDYEKLLKSKKEFAKGVTRDGYIAVRIPMNETCIELANEMPVVTTSANLHGEKIDISQ